MRTALEIVFWGSVFLVAYPYVVYPLLIGLLGLVRPRPVRKTPCLPSVTILIPAYNEADCIEATVRNKLELDYPADRLQIIVVSDGSDDGTDDIVKGFAERGVALMRREGREGKAAALNAAVRMATGEIVVFSDANSLFAADALKRIVENFSDPDVGYVTGVLGFFNDASAGVAGAGGGAYLRYENALRAAETRIGSIIGVNGGVDAIRRELYTDIPKQLITDFVLPLTVIARGRRVVQEPAAQARESANTEMGSEFRMRVRVALRALQGLAYMRRLLNPFRHPLVAFCLVSHKVLRYLAFVFMFTALAANVVLAIDSPFYRGLMVLQAAGYALGLAGLYAGLPRPLGKLVGAPGYLLMTYAAFGVATFRFLRGDTMATWRPRAG